MTQEEADKYFVDLINHVWGDAVAWLDETGTIRSRLNKLGKMDGRKDVPAFCRGPAIEFGER